MSYDHDIISDKTSVPLQLPSISNMILPNPNACSFSSTHLTALLKVAIPPLHLPLSRCWANPAKVEKYSIFPGGCRWVDRPSCMNNNGQWKTRGSWTAEFICISKALALPNDFREGGQRWQRRFRGGIWLTASLIVSKSSSLGDEGPDCAVTMLQSDDGSLPNGDSGSRLISDHALPDSSASIKETLHKRPLS